MVGVLLRWSDNVSESCSDNVSHWPALLECSHEVQRFGESAGIVPARMQ
jgi:hypothetical protein